MKLIKFLFIAILIFVFTIKANVQQKLFENQHIDSVYHINPQSQQFDFVQNEIIRHSSFGKNKSGIVINPADYEYSGQVTAAVFIDEVNVGSADNELIAWVDGEARGITKGLYFSPKDHWVYSLMIYSNLAEGDTVEFTFYDAGSQEQISFSEQLIFAPDMIIANAEEPYELRELRANTESLDHSFTQSLNVFPNPVTYTATISFTLTQSQQVTFDVINAFGQFVDRINQGVMPEGIHQISWSTEKLDSGIYMILRSDNPSVFQKVILLK